MKSTAHIVILAATIFFLAVPGTATLNSSPGLDDKGAARDTDVTGQSSEPFTPPSDEV